MPKTIRYIKCHLSELGSSEGQIRSVEEYQSRCADLELGGTGTPSKHGCREVDPSGVIGAIEFAWGPESGRGRPVRCGSSRDGEARNDRIGPLQQRWRTYLGVGVDHQTRPEAQNAEPDLLVHNAQSNVRMPDHALRERRLASLCQKDAHL